MFYFFYFITYQMLSTPNFMKYYQILDTKFDILIAKHLHNYNSQVQQFIETTTKKKYQKQNLK